MTYHKEVMYERLLKAYFWIKNLICNVFLRQDPDYTTRYQTNDPLLYEPDRSPTMSSQHRRRSRTSLSSRRSRSSAKKKSSKNSHRTSRSRSPSSIMPDATSSVSLSKKSLLKTYTLPKGKLNHVFYCFNLLNQFQR